MKNFLFINSIWEWTTFPWIECLKYCQEKHSLNLYFHLSVWYNFYCGHDSVSAFSGQIHPSPFSFSLKNMRQKVCNASNTSCKVTISFIMKQPISWQCFSGIKRCDDGLISGCRMNIQTTAIHLYNLFLEVSWRSHCGSWMYNE